MRACCPHVSLFVFVRGPVRVLTPLHVQSRPSAVLPMPPSSPPYAHAGRVRGARATQCGHGVPRRALPTLTLTLRLIPSRTPTRTPTLALILGTLALTLCIQTLQPDPFYSTPDLSLTLTLNQVAELRATLTLTLTQTLTLTLTLTLTQTLTLILTLTLTLTLTLILTLTLTLGCGRAYRCRSLLCATTRGAG